ncbi:hypothetical protein GA830_19740 (plasmid) [Mesorhizobium sp. NBSH29]|nr:hypothetical protein [Mesorhizobium sp. NBSH29]QPC88844.1 hypothetical protein GA830_18355 [Mesorhizobium sp. NBSH29]QPC89055.1 hypothetical protein GA830_19740 [Mesorhizobium sp. NBSH29]
MTVIISSSQSVRDCDRTNNKVFNQRMVIYAAVDDADQRRVLGKFCEIRQVSNRQVDHLRTLVVSSVGRKSISAISSMVSSVCATAPSHRTRISVVLGPMYRSSSSPFRAST